MTVGVEDPLIAGMAITQTLPLHESSRRLRELYPECPRVYGVAVMGDSSRRRWWPLAQALTSDRLQTMFNVAAAETSSRAAATQQLVGHAGPCHHRACGAAGRAGGPGWDTGLENLWVHVDSEGAIDWVSWIRRCGRCRTTRSLLTAPRSGGRMTRALSRYPVKRR